MYIQYTLAILVNIKIRQLKASVFFFFVTCVESGAVFSEPRVALKNSYN